MNFVTTASFNGVSSKAQMVFLNEQMIMPREYYAWKHILLIYE